MIALEVSELSFSYGEIPLFSDVGLSVSEGECVALTGPSGCGKSTLCYILSGIIPRSIDGNINGDVRLFGNNPSELSLSETIERVGVVFQNPESQLFSPTIEDEVAFGPENLCLPREEISRRITSALVAVGMQDFRHTNPSQLSGGQKQLVALAAVLALQPRALIFDESLSQLDPDSAALVKQAIQAQKQQGKAILIVEHNEENLDVADRIYTFANGRLAEVGNG